MDVQLFGSGVTAIDVNKTREAYISLTASVQKIGINQTPVKPNSRHMSTAWWGLALWSHPALSASASSSTPPLTRAFWESSSQSLDALLPYFLQFF